MYVSVWEKEKESACDNLTTTTTTTTIIIIIIIIIITNFCYFKIRKDQSV